MWFEDMQTHQILWIFVQITPIWYIVHHNIHYQARVIDLQILGGN